MTAANSTAANSTAANSTAVNSTAAVNSLSLVTVDAVSSSDRDKIINACGLVVSKHCDAAALLHFFCSLPKSGVYACPIELVKANTTEFDNFTTSLVNVLTRKLGLDYEHVAVGCGGDPHEAFDNDITTGHRVDECLEDTYARARVLNNENLFRAVAKTASFQKPPRIVWVRDVREFKSTHVFLQ